MNGNNTKGDIMDLFLIIIKTIFFYLFILIIFRIMGKREMGKLSVSDLVVSILIAELCAISIENYNDSIILTIIPIIILLIFEMICGYLSLKSNRFRNILEGKPSLIINRGKINYKEMIRQRYSLDDLMLELRNNNIKYLCDVEYAILEHNGHLNIFKYKYLSKNVCPFPLILDGVIQEDTLNYLDKSIEWLEDYLNKLDIELFDIFYCFYKNNKIYIIKKEDLK